MTRTTLPSMLCLLLSPLLVAQQVAENAALALVQSPSAPAKSDHFEIPKGTNIPLVLLDPVSSATVRKGQTIRLAVARDVVNEGTVVIRRGTVASGAVWKVQKAITCKKDGYAIIELVSLTLPNGSLPITQYVSHKKDAGGDGWCWSFGSCLVLLVIMYAIFLPVVSVRELFDRQSGLPASTRDETKDVCSPIWAVTKAAGSVEVAHFEGMLETAEVDATCPISKDEFSRISSALQMR